MSQNCLKTQKSSLKLKESIISLYFKGKHYLFSDFQKFYVRK